jgi:alkylation response protein AidB-like acyl-CoA dehydrogenase
VAGELDRTDTYPDQIVAGLRELGVFGLTIDPEYGGLGESLLTYALVAEEIARGWMSISGIINTHFIVAYLISRHGTAEQRAAFLAFGKPIAQHQAIEFKLAEMGTKVVAAHQMMVMAARRKDSGGQADLEAGMAKYLASEYGKEVVEDALRIHGGYGYSQEYEIERLYRDVPMLLIGEGTVEIQKMIIGRRLLERFAVASG